MIHDFDSSSAKKTKKAKNDEIPNETVHLFGVHVRLPSVIEQQNHIITFTTNNTQIQNLKKNLRASKWMWIKWNVDGVWYPRLYHMQFKLWFISIVSFVSDWNDKNE